MLKHCIAACLAAFFLSSCGADSEDRRKPGKQDGYSLVAESSSQLTLSFEIFSIYRNISLQGIKASCNERLAASEKASDFQYSDYEYAGAEKKCIRRNIFNQCEVHQYLHTVNCHFVKIN